MHSVISTKTKEITIVQDLLNLFCQNFGRYISHFSTDHQKILMRLNRQSNRLLNSTNLLLDDYQLLFDSFDIIHQINSKIMIAAIEKKVVEYRYLNLSTLPYESIISFQAIDSIKFAIQDKYSCDCFSDQVLFDLGYEVMWQFIVCSAKCFPITNYNRKHISSEPNGTNRLFVPDEIRKIIDGKHISFLELNVAYQYLKTTINHYVLRNKNTGGQKIVCNQ